MQKLRQELGAYSRAWMETYYHDREMVAHYVRAYGDIIYCPDTFQRLRFDAGSRRQIFMAQQADDLVWEARKTQFFKWAQSFTCKALRHCERWENIKRTRTQLDQSARSQTFEKIYFGST